MATQPNILLFLTDDHGAWANGSYGNREVKTPTLDKLAAEGTRFTHAYTPVPVCSPARANLLTGKTASQVGIHDWIEETDKTAANHDWLHGIPTLFDRFHAAGYRTGLSGKWHLGRSHLPPTGADYHFGLPYWQGAHNEAYTYVYNGEMIELEGNKSGFITDHAIEFLDTTHNDTPFFLCVGYIATHSPYNQQTHDPDLTAQYQDAEFLDIPDYESHPWVKNEGTDNQPTRDDLHDRYIGYYAAVTELDNNIKRIVDKLEADGKLENTLIIYTSDHGCAIGHKGFFGKGNSTRPLNMYEISLHVPLIWRSPDVNRGQVIDAYVDHCDTFRAIVEAANLALDDADEYPGRSYLPIVQGDTPEVLGWDNTRYGEYGDLRMIRDERWKLVWRYPDGPHDLFDLQNDPNEENNRYSDEAMQAVVDELKTKLDSYFETYTDPAYSGLRVKELLPRHNTGNEAWRDGRREARGLQVY